MKTDTREEMVVMSEGGTEIEAKGAREERGETGETEVTEAIEATEATEE